MTSRHLGAHRFLVGLLAAAFVLCGLSRPAHAVLAAVSTNPDGTFLVHPANGFPQWYQDAGGVALTQCNFGVSGDPVGFVNDPNCLPAGASARPLPNLPFDESFYWTGDIDVGALDGGNISGAILVMALEAAFATGDPAPNQQMVFARIRFRADASAVGTYTLTHPYGVDTFTVDAIGPGPEINFTEDIGITPLGFAEALNGRVGPFLTCVNPAPPAGYLGSVAVPCTVTGSPNGTNFANITGPLTNTTTNLFLIGGKIDPGVPFTPLTVDAATYRCDLAGSCQVDVTAHSDPTASLTAAAGGFAAAPMVGDGLGGFNGTLQVVQSSIPFPANPLVNPPFMVNVAAVQAPNIPVSKKTVLVDAVTITQATHNLATGIVSVRATAGDMRATLTEVQLGKFTGGAIDVDLNGFTTLTIPQTSVTVVSNAGGSATSAVQIINVPETLKAKATFNKARRRLTITITSTVRGATILVSSGAKQLGSGLVDANGRFKVTVRVNRKPRRIQVTSSGGGFVKATVR